MVLTMRKRCNNLAARGLVVMLLALFAVPCIACDDGIAHLLCPHAHETVLSTHIATSGTGCDISRTPHQEAPPCQCLSDTSKVYAERSLATQIVPNAVLPPGFIALSEPTRVRVTNSGLVYSLPPLLLHPAAPGRAPPAA